MWSGDSEYMREVNTNKKMIDTKLYGKIVELKKTSSFMDVAVWRDIWTRKNGSKNVHVQVVQHIYYYNM